MNPVIRKEDHFFLATVLVEGGEFENLKCKLYLPEKPADRIWLYIYPTEEQTRKINSVANKLWKFSIKGETTTRLGEHILINAEKVYTSSVEGPQWDNKAHETIWVAEATDLKIQQLSRNGSENDKTTGYFWLTQSLILNPFIQRSFLHTGEVKIEWNETVKFNLANDFKLDFQAHFKTRKNESDEEIFTKHLRAESNLIDDPKASEKINDGLLNQLDDFLLITSFAARQRCVCFGWEVFDSIGYTRFYRRDISIPKYDSKHDIGECVVRPESFEEFLQVAYHNFVKDPEIKLLRDAIRGAIRRDNFTVETSFTRLFSALETLVLAFRRQHNLEYIFSEEKEADEWKTILKVMLPAWLKEQPLLSGNDRSHKRNWVYKNLAALERVPFADSFEKFLEFYNLDLSDLWNISGGGEKNWSLTKIRNKLVHGDEFSDRKTGALVAATLHLQWTLERAILVYLGWDISKSFVRSESLSGRTAYSQLEVNRKIIADINMT